jgi:hypothetical protein
VQVETTCTTGAFTPELCEGFSFAEAFKRVLLAGLMQIRQFSFCGVFLTVFFKSRRTQKPSKYTAILSHQNQEYLTQKPRGNNFIPVWNNSVCH